MNRYIGPQDAGMFQNPRLQPPGVLGQGPSQGPPTPQGFPALATSGVPVLDSRALPPPPQMRPTQAVEQFARERMAQTPNPNTRSVGYQLGSMLLPALAGRLLGANSRDAQRFGAGSAAFNYNDQLQRNRETEAQIAQARMGLPEREMAYDTERAKQQELLAREKFYAQGGSAGSGSASYQTWVALGKPYAGNGVDDNTAFIKWAEENTRASTNDPGLIETFRILGGGDMEKGKDLYVRMKGAEAQSKASGTATPGIQQGLLQSGLSIEAMSKGYDNLLVSMEKSQQTGLLRGEALAKVSSDYQSMRQQMYSLALQNIGALKAQGIALNPLTEKEIEILFSTQPQLSNNHAANVEILKREKQKLETLYGDIRSQIDWINQGNSPESWQPKRWSQGEGQSSSPSTGSPKGTVQQPRVIQ